MGLMSTLARWRSSRELAALGTDEIGALARDIGISTDRLAYLAQAGAASGEQLHRLMHEVGLERDRARRAEPGVMRDMSLVCSACMEARRCRRDLAHGQASAVLSYCPNADTLQALQAAAHRQVQ